MSQIPKLYIGLTVDKFQVFIRNGFCGNSPVVGTFGGSAGWGFWEGAETQHISYPLLQRGEFPKCWYLTPSHLRKSSWQVPFIIFMQSSVIRPHKIHCTNSIVNFGGTVISSRITPTVILSNYGKFKNSSSARPSRLH